MKTVLIIGIGAGDPDHVTIQAVKAMNTVDVFFLMDKGPAKTKLNGLRREICRRHVERPHRFAEAEMPERDREARYDAAVADLNARKQGAFEALIADEMADGETGAFLVWGDPSLYDSTIRNVRAIAESGRHAVDWEVVPGITSVQALTARHRTTLNRVGKPVEITTGRLLARGMSGDTDTTVVMLDGENAYRSVAADPDVEIFWGAYLGTPDEILLSGNLSEVAGEIDRLRAAAREANGWIMDCYMLRKGGED